MAEVQTTYSEDFAIGYPGFTPNGETENRLTRTIEDVAGIAFGVAAFQGAEDHGCTATPSADFLGFTIAHQALGHLAGQAVDKYHRYENVAIKSLGTIMVTAGVALAPRDPIYITPAGAITNVDGGGANFEATGWQADSTAANGALVRLAKR